MYAVQTDQLDFIPAHHVDRPENTVRAAWPVHRGTGSRASATVVFELAKGMQLGTHTDSAEEVLIVLDGEVEITVGDERRRARTGAIAVVPAEVRHNVAGVGETPARVVGVFGSNTIVSVFDEEWEPFGTRVLGTPPPAELAG